MRAPGFLSRLWRDPRQLSLAITIGLFVAMSVAGGVMYDGFLRPQVFLNLLIDNAFLLIVAVGMTFVIVSGGIDLSVGAVVAFSTVLLAWLVQVHGWHPLAAIPLVLALGAAFGALMGMLIERYRLQPFVVTLAGMFLARGAATLLSVESIGIDHAFHVAVANLRIPLGGGASLSAGAVIALLVVAGGAVLAGMTRFGRGVYAIGGSEASALLMGLPVAATRVGVYALSGFCSALAGVVYTFYMLSGYSLHATGLELDAIAAVVIGGTLLAGGSGYVLGTLFGVLVLGLIQTLIVFDGTLSSWWTKIAIGGLLLAFCLLQQLLVRSSRRRAPQEPPA
ncbi:sugar ABC transporter permease YjfF [Pseudoxanthomonas daejeonensis]|uniref:galactofuranose ABC transporter, permease protein YjfF n=1 Tax=Pseudoxanthomonas daejeonensis TaxID=266062 RepID=UPI001F54747B|nr:galactofuranose ABC transporter, permease protein YjfF [Pseudoxanthomonas daejeonensis]UNK59112.1 sugar ABC transporter permease YjfF [Pseudoxanthomonas daejeonensis]